VEKDAEKLSRTNSGREKSGPIANTAAERPISKSSTLDFCAARDIVSVRGILYGVKNL
jgi:hypothetical protein